MFQKDKDERKIYTTNFDFAVQDLVTKMESEDIIIPDLQRDYVWNAGNKEDKTSRLIESLLLNMPIPTFYFAESDTLKYEVIDGMQRITTFKRYLKDEFALESLEDKHDLNGKKFSELKQIDRDKIRKRGVRAIVIGNESDPEIKFDIFERLNTGSVVLTSQEVRNAIYIGNFNDLLKKLAPKVNNAFQFSTKEDILRKSGGRNGFEIFCFLCTRRGKLWN